MRLTRIFTLVLAAGVAGCAAPHADTPTISWEKGVPSTRFSFSGPSATGDAPFRLQYEIAPDEWVAFFLPDAPPPEFILEAHPTPTTFVLRHKNSTGPVVFEYVGESGLLRVRDPDMSEYWLKGK